MEVARSVLLGRSLQFQGCEAKTEGSSRIRPGNRLTVKYLGRHSDGEYLVYSVEHSLSAQEGYFTTCHLKRNFCGVSNNRSISAIDRERIDRQGANAQEENAAATMKKRRTTQKTHLLKKLRQSQTRAGKMKTAGHLQKPWSAMKSFFAPM